jgi:hypothetical protein
MIQALYFNIHDSSSAINSANLVSNSVQRSLSNFFKNATAQCRIIPEKDSIQKPRK